MQITHGPLLLLRQANMVREHPAARLMHSPKDEGAEKITEHPDSIETWFDPLQNTSPPAIPGGMTRTPDGAGEF